MSDSEEVRLDFSDILVRMMANHNHVPDEQWLEGRLQPILCATCDQAWPCATRVELGINGETISAFAFNGKEYGVFEKNGTPLMIVDNEVYEMTQVSDEGDDDAE